MESEESLPNREYRYACWRSRSRGLEMEMSGDDVVEVERRNGIETGS